MVYVIKFMIYILIGISVTVPVAGIIAWHMDDKKEEFKEWVKTF